ncbi:hypothetical protein K3G63_22410 [Hymenobacter sp. HSC-4F20]|uniref:SpvB/TcaC N-terminal domain-containing protein n=1 Tax=Hymenobacter sp. HSC-4F20 TaxID=2864135 RepID=UPI001C735092|nr:SpvB/TcaC N-terminal domain-containing protein [Hymenobacter sp. HSC-4F20]MBX0293215.1 hypothetical protein [Hymenobacter sp. HSC-4F20]
MNAPAGSCLPARPNSGATGCSGEQFSPDLFTGTGTFSVPIALPPGSHTLQPGLTLRYSTSAGNSAFGWGWNAAVASVRRSTRAGIPQYADDQDVFLLSGLNELVPIRWENLLGGAEGTTLLGTVAQYRPRTEGMFARIEHYRYHDNGPNYWQVRTTDGLISTYGEPELPVAAAGNLAVLADPEHPAHVLAWHLTRTVDPLGNEIRYGYRREQAQEGPHHYEQTYLTSIRYAAYPPDAPRRCGVSVELNYGPRPDPFSTYDAGFEQRTTRRCTSICTYTTPDAPSAGAGSRESVATYSFSYLDEDASTAGPPLAGVSLLRRVLITGPRHQASGPPLEFGYSCFQPADQCFFPLGGELPAASLASPGMALLDLFGRGLPDVVELAEAGGHYWKNLGYGVFDQPRPLRATAVGLQPTAPQEKKQPRLSEEGTAAVLRARCRPTAPGLTGVNQGLRAPAGAAELPFDDYPGLCPQDPRLRRALFAPGLPAVVLVEEKQVAYWPNLGRGRWGRRIAMRNSPRLPHCYDPARLLLGDVDGDGLDDLLYVEDTGLTLWLNRSGNAWSDPIRLTGPPTLLSPAAVRLVDLLGTGVAGLLWTCAALAGGRPHHHFLDFTAGVRPYLLKQLATSPSTLTRVEYAASTTYYLQDERRPATRWHTRLPFPVPVVARVEVREGHSGTATATSYCYHHGAGSADELGVWGFGRVDQHTTIRRYQAVAAADAWSCRAGNKPSWAYEEQEFALDERLIPALCSALEPCLPGNSEPPAGLLETRCWFHLGPVRNERDEWQELDLTHEYQATAPSVLKRPAATDELLRALPGRHRRAAYRALRGSKLRTEEYVSTGAGRPSQLHRVAESLPGVARVVPRQLDTDVFGSWLSFDGQLPPLAQLVAPLSSQLIFFPHHLGQCTTEWPAGGAPRTQLAFLGDYDSYGQAQQRLHLALPPGQHPAAPAAGVRLTHLRTEYAGYDNDPASPLYCHSYYDSPAEYQPSRLAQTRCCETDATTTCRSALELAQAVLAGQVSASAPAAGQEKRLDRTAPPICTHCLSFPFSTRRYDAHPL